MFRGDDGLDELTTTTTSSLWSIVGGVVSPHRLDSEELGLARSVPADLKGGDAVYNAEVVRRVVGGETGPVRDAVLLNAAAAIAAYDVNEDLVVTRIAEGLQRAAESVDSGAAEAKLAAWVSAVAAVDGYPSTPTEKAASRS